jgi:transcription-repair coupling factor (superfamily II helicase)
MSDNIFSKIHKAKSVKSISIPVLALYLLKHQETNARLVLVPEENDAYNLINNIRSLSNNSHKNFFIFPEWDSRPEYNISPGLHVQAKRLLALFNLLNSSEHVCVISSITAVSQFLPPVSYLYDSTEVLRLSQKIDTGSMTLKLIDSGYQRSDIVNIPGLFSTRGNIIDIFPASQKKPIRVELFGNTIESIKIFDPSTQRSIQKVEKTYISPVREISFSEKGLLCFKEKLKRFCDSNNIKKDVRSKIIDSANNGIYFPGIEYFLPFFYDQLSTIYDYIPEGSEIIVVDEYLFNPDNNTLYEPTVDEDNVPYPTGELFMDKDLSLTIMNNKKTKQMYSIEFEAVHDNEENSFSLKEYISNHNIFKREIAASKREGLDTIEILKRYHKEALTKKFPIIYTSLSQDHAERLLYIIRRFEDNIIIASDKELLNLIDNPPGHPIICISELTEGFTINRPQVFVITETDIFGEKQKNVQIQKSSDVFLDVFKELKEDDYVVHSKHGVGIYRGLKKIAIDGIENDFFQIEYSDKDLLFVPVYRLNTVQRYIAQGGGHVRLDKLGGNSWQKKKQKAKRSTMDLAHELIKLQAQRASRKGFSFSPTDEIYLKMESEFEYEETPDQLKSIKDVISDMEKTTPMDRLVCGDVGFGKTEVAIRAAFKAVKDSKQVAILVPTTILAFQHHQVFQKRLQNYPVNIESLTRFKTPAQQYEIIEKLKKGDIDVIIGTHRLLSSDVNYLDLGLLVIDEEQKFGVKHKEKIKEITASVDVLTLTATPIPRTLNLAFIGLKDISVITTPPVKRMPIKTFVAKFSSDLIKKAILFEIGRGGQVFFVHNRVQDIPELYEKLKSFLPDVRIITAHGQMKEKELEQKMMAFYNKEADVLLCTSIIESGLDIPNTNTIIINRADMFGLSQLYQIRGRVGRSNQRAYCYLLLPYHFTVGKMAIDRLKALQTFTELGSGFNVASHDLEFRGAGELLGSSQSGFIEDIGLEEYLELLEESIDQIKGKEKEEKIEPEISINVPAFIPETYVSDITQRLYFYKKLSNSNELNSLKDIEDEFIDRYGPVPDELKNLFNIVKIKQFLKPLRISSVKIGNGKLVYSFDQSTKILPERIVHLVTNLPKKFKITPEMKLISNIDDNDWRSAIREIENFISIVGG